MTALDTEVPSVTETRGREEAGTWVQSREGVLKMLFCQTDLRFWSYIGFSAIINHNNNFKKN